MTTPLHPDSDAAADLLAERERRALRWTAFSRLGCIGLSVAVMPFIILRTSEAVAILALLGAGVLVQLVLLRRLRRPSRGIAVGLLGTGTDMVVMCALPLIWHLIYTTPGEPLVHLRAHNFVAVSLAFIAMNALSMRPLYPALLTVMAVAVHLTLAGLALTDPRLDGFPGGLDTALGVGTGVSDLVFTTPFFIGLTGALITLAVYAARGAVREAVRREHAQGALQQRRLQDMLHAKMAAVGDLVAGVQHEVNSPLGALHSAVDTAAKAKSRIAAAAGEDRSVHRAFAVLDSSLQTVEHASQRLAAVMATIRGFVQLDRAELQRLELGPLVRTAIEAQRSAFNADTRLHLDLEDGLVVEADPGRIAQALATVLRNAGEALDGPGDLHVALERRGAQACVAVKDSGRGMPPEQVQGLFDIDFAHGERTRARFGLPLARNILHRHGGNIGLDSRPGAGTTVTLTLPLATKED